MSPQDTRRHTPLRTIRIDEPLWAAVQETAERRGETVSDVVRDALRGYVAQHVAGDPRSEPDRHPCGECGAQPGERCRTRTGRPTGTMHAERRRLARDWQESYGYYTEGGQA